MDIFNIMLLQNNRFIRKTDCLHENEDIDALQELEEIGQTMCEHYVGNQESVVTLRNRTMHHTNINKYIYFKQ